MEHIKRLIKDTYIQRKQAEKNIANVKANTEKIQKAFDEKKLKELIVESNAESNEPPLLAKKTERVTVDYFVDKLKEQLNSDIFDEIVVKTYVVDDMKGLINMLKVAGVSAKEFKKFIRVDQKVDRAAIRRLYDSKDITKEDIRGCYTANVVKSINISQMKLEE